MGRKDRSPRRASPSRVANGPVVMGALLLAALATTGIFWTANHLLEVWIDCRLDHGVVPPWEDPAVSAVAHRGAQRRWTDRRYDRLRWLDPALYEQFESLEPPDNRNTQAHWIGRWTDFAPKEIEGQPPRLNRASLENFLKELQSRAKQKGGAWPRPRERDPDPEKTPGWSYLGSLLIGNEWRSSIESRLRGTTVPWRHPGGLAGGEVEEGVSDRISAFSRRLLDDPTAFLRRVIGLRDPLPPRPFEGDLWLIDRTSGVFNDHEPELQALESFVGGMIIRLQEVAALPRRLSTALNGPIQWITLMVAMWCFFLLGWRAYWIHRESRAATHRDRALLENVADAAGSPGNSIEEWLVSIIPMLGFIGTIIGMMLAMGNAGEVVTAEGNAELQRAVDKLAGYLGTAFDTTLIALLVAIPLEGLRRLVASSQTQFMDRLDRLTNRVGRAPEEGAQGEERGEGESFRDGKDPVKGSDEAA